MPNILADFLFKKPSKNTNNNESFNLLQQHQINALVGNVKESRIEQVFLDKYKDKENNFLSESHLNNLRSHANNRYIKTLENIRYAVNISNKLKTQNINHSFLKGTALILAYEADPLRRAISDVDILIDKRNLSLVIDILRELEFDTKNWDKINFNKLEVYKNPTIKHKSSPAQVDIHFQIFSDIFQERREKLNYEKKILASLENYKVSDIKIYSIEMLAVHLLYHGTIHNSYNVGPIFIQDFLFLLKFKYICWDTFLNYVEVYNLQTELIRVLSVCSQFVVIPEELKKIQNFVRDDETEELLELFMAPPNSSGIFSYTARSDEKIKFLLSKVFSKRNILIHNQDKLTFSKFFKYLNTLLNKHLVGATKKNKGFQIAYLRSKYMKRKTKKDVF